MNKDRAIQLLERMQNPEPYDPQITSEAFDAIQMAIDALSADGDTISRKAAVKILHEALDAADQIADVPFGVYQNYRDKMNELPPAQPKQQHGRIFREIVVEYPSYCTYPEYKGKPYFSIKYTENGQEFIGYGTYKPEVLSKYLKEYFMPPAQPKPNRGRWIYKTDLITAPTGYWECSECKEGRLLYEENFCPNCGAKMEVTE